MWYIYSEPGVYLGSALAWQTSKSIIRLLAGFILNPAKDPIIPEALTLGLQ